MPDSLTDQLDAVLPQTQCTRCGYPACRPYAQAMANGEAGPNRCPPGGVQGIAQLAALLDQPVTELADEVGQFGPRLLATIETEHCIGCTKCILACPVDAIIGGPKWMHTVLPALCTGCELCLAPCPVDCIRMEPVDQQFAWSQSDAIAARGRYEQRISRRARNDEQDTMRHIDEASEKLAELDAGQSDSPTTDNDQSRKKAIIAAAIARARERQAKR